MTLAEFLLARIAEDEAWAEMVQRAPRVGAGEARRVQEGNAVFVPLGLATSPARVLADCEAKRRIVGEHPGHYVCERCMGDPRLGPNGLPTAKRQPCPTLRILATAYADHPDYREEWRA